MPDELVGYVGPVAPVAPDVSPPNVGVGEVGWLVEAKALPENRLPLSSPQLRPVAMRRLTRPPTACLLALLKAAATACFWLCPDAILSQMLLWIVVRSLPLRSGIFLLLKLGQRSLKRPLVL